MNDLQSVLYPAGVNRTGTKMQLRLDASNRLGLAGGMLPKGVICEGVELTGLNVLFELTIPLSPVERKKPVTELCQFFSGESPDLTFNSLDFAHDHQFSTDLQSSDNTGVQRRGQSCGSSTELPGPTRRLLYLC